MRCYQSRRFTTRATPSGPPPWDHRSRRRRHTWLVGESRGRLSPTFRVIPISERLMFSTAHRCQQVRCCSCRTLTHFIVRGKRTWQWPELMRMRLLEVGCTVDDRLTGTCGRRVIALSHDTPID